METPPVVLSIAGYDPSSGAGVTADIKTAAALGCYGVTCITALTVQSTQGVFGVEPVVPGLISETLASLADDLPIAAVRIGMLGSGAVAEAVAHFLEIRKLPNIVLDPVLRSSSGSPLLAPGGLELMRRRLLPLCEVVTPNVSEAATLAQLEPPHSVSWDQAAPWLVEVADELHRLGSPAVVITGGHLNPANDLLSYTEDGVRKEQVFPGSRIESQATHGTGCAFATAVACQLALGRELPEAVGLAKQFVRRSIEEAYPLGRGNGPLNPFFGLKPWRL